MRDLGQSRLVKERALHQGVETVQAAKKVLALLLEVDDFLGVHLKLILLNFKRASQARKASRLPGFQSGFETSLQN
jgi:hypothetical protein